MEIETVLRPVAFSLELLGGGCLLWVGLSPANWRAHLAELLVLGNLTALGIVTLFAVAIRSELALSAGLIVFALLLVLLRKVAHDLRHGPHFMDMPNGLSGSAPSAPPR